MKPRLKPLAVAVAAAGVIGVGTLASLPSHAGILDYFHGKDTTQTQAAAAPPAPAAQQLALADTSPATAPNYRQIVKTWGPAVVGVTVEGVRKSDDDNDASNQSAPSGPSGPSANNDPFFQFFRGVPGFQMPHRGAQPFRGQGSGFIISADGLILTNAHVVRDAREVTVKLADRREFVAKVLGSDPATDIAVLRVDAHDLPTVQIGDPKALQVGDNVLAIGAPFGFDESATAGIVSAKGRSLPGDAYVPFIQTDAAVNPGNSGGPLFDGNGRVVGINAQIYSQTGGYQGLAFAIPIDVALRAKDQIVATGHVDHARLGVQIQDLSQQLADSFGLQRPDGALVASVDPDGAAAHAGLKPGDVVTQIDSDPVAGAGDLSQRIGGDTPGTTVALKVWRDHGWRQIDVKLGAAETANGDGAKVASAEGGKLGLALRPLSADERSAAELDHGLMIEQVAGAAARAGLQPGDVLLGIDGQPATSVQQVRTVVKDHPKVVALLIERNGNQIFVPVKLG